MRLVISCLLCMFFCIPCVSHAYDAYNGEKIPPLTRDEGRVNLTHEWVVHHGARTYWRSVQAPLQVKLSGMEFKDPADICLDVNDLCKDKKKYRRYTKKKARKSYVKRKVKKTRKVKPVARATISTKPRPQRALGPVKPRNRSTGVGTLPMKPADPVGNPLQ